MTDSETMARLANNLRLKRLKAGLSLNEVARRAGTYASTIKEVEDGERMPGVGLATRIAEAVGSTLNALLQPTANGTK